MKQHVKHQKVLMGKNEWPGPTIFRRSSLIPQQQDNKKKQKDNNKQRTTDRMGNLFASLLSRIKKRDTRVLLLGLDHAGKTTGK